VDLVESELVASQWMPVKEREVFVLTVDERRPPHSEQHDIYTHHVNQFTASF